MNMNLFSEHCTSMKFSTGQEWRPSHRLCSNKTGEEKRGSGDSRKE